MQWSRAQTGYISYSPVSIKLKDIIEETINLLLSDAQQKNITLESTVIAEIMVYADENMLKTILRNLIANAIKFTPNNGRIYIEAGNRKSEVEVIVGDTGVGISKEDIDKLFRIDTVFTTLGTADEKGTGLGLLLCKEFVEKHGGKIWIDSIEGKGSEFKFTLPLG